MGTEGIRNLEWLDRGSDSRYPLQSGATAKDRTGVFEIPNDFLASLYIAVPADLDMQLETARVGELIQARSQIIVRFFATINGSDVQFAQMTIGRLQAEKQIKAIGYALGLVTGVGSYSAVKGQAAIARMSIIDQPLGKFEFDYDGAGLDIDVLRPNIRFVSAVDVETQSGGFSRIDGPLRLRAGDNVQLRLVQEDGEPVVYFDALDGSQFNKQLECELGDLPPIRTINGIPGGPDRAVDIEQGRCLEASVTGSALGLRNECSEPCASCEEAETLKSAIDPLVEQIPTLVNFISRLEAAIDAQNMAMQLSQFPLECRTTTTAPPGP
ncbi:MAG: hypothetical protein KatS3mg109_0012 [Pirellulaceae bacterium]|nr:MAG: hypothetical protein KatS3mg109_0012 [Pirellulaceae bacterium]